MPRVTHVQKARKAIPSAGIKKGEPYYWWKFKNCGKSVSRTMPKPSQLTRSEFWSTVYSWTECDTPGMDDIESEIDELKSNVEALRDEQEEKRSNMPEQLQDSGSGETLQERYDALDSLVSELENIDVSFELDDSEGAEGEEEQKSNRASEIWQEVEEAIGNLSC